MYNSNNSATIYVSQTNGNDEWSGLSPTQEPCRNGPFRTLKRALKLAWYMRETGIRHPLTIALTEDYHLDAPLKLHNGIKGVTLTSYGSRKRILGGFRLEGWRKDTFMGVDCLSATLPPREDGQTWSFTDLFVNGKRAAVTRYPKEGMLKLIDTEEERRGGHFHSAHHSGTSRWFIVHPEDLRGIDHVEDAMINYYHYWIDEHSPIESYDYDSGKLVMSLTSRFSVSAMYGIDSHGATQYYLTGVPNTFSKPGEWYLNRQTQTVYYIPEDESITPETIEAYVPTLDRLIDIEGEDIHLKNLELTVTTGDYASVLSRNEETGEETYCGSDIQSVCSAPGAITFTGAERCGMHNCYLHGVGVHGVNITENCHHIRIEQNRIEDVCAGGVRIFGGEVLGDPVKTTSDCAIVGNHISHCGRRYAAGCGVLLMNSHDNEICDNEIHDLYYSGISAGWLWGYCENVSYGNRICRNHIHHIGNGWLSDIGGVYLLGPQRGTVVSENRIHDVTCAQYGAWGIYLDEGSSFITVENNAIYRTQSNCFHLHYGSHNVVRNNIFWSGTAPCIRISQEELHPQIIFEQNILITDGAPIYHYRGDHSLHSRKNLLWDYQNGTPTAFRHKFGEEATLEEWQTQYAHDHGSIVADPLIPNLASYDFTLAEGSPAFDLDFTPLPDFVAKGK